MCSDAASFLFSSRSGCVRMRRAFRFSLCSNVLECGEFFGFGSNWMCSDEASISGWARFGSNVSGCGEVFGIGSVRLYSDEVNFSVWTRFGCVRMRRSFRFRLGSRREFWFHFGSDVFGCGEPFGRG